MNPSRVVVRSALRELNLPTSCKVYMKRLLPVQFLKGAAVGACSLLLLSACAMFSGVQSAQATAQSAISQGNVNVYLQNGVAVVTGFVPDASSEQAVKRALLKRDDVDSVEMNLHREM